MTTQNPIVTRHGGYYSPAHDEYIPAWYQAQHPDSDLVGISERSPEDAIENLKRQQLGIE